MKMELRLFVWNIRTITAAGHEEEARDSYQHADDDTLWATRRNSWEFTTVGDEESESANKMVAQMLFTKQSHMWISMSTSAHKKNSETFRGNDVIFSFFLAQVF